MKKNTKNKKWFKANWAIVIVIVSFGIIAAYLVKLAVFDGDSNSQAALSQTERVIDEIEAKRGDILDRNNTVLASSIVKYEMILEPANILVNPDKYLEPTVSLLEEYFGFSASELRQKIYDRPNSLYVPLSDSVTYDQMNEFKALASEDGNVRGVSFKEYYKRSYAYDTLACSVLGFMEDGVGAYGIEKYYEDELSGTSGKEYTYVNGENVIEIESIEPVTGNTVRTTLDYNIQSIVEKYIDQYVEEAGAKAVAAIVMDPNTGEILAMADSNKFNVNSPRDLSYTYSETEIKLMSDAQTLDALNENWKNYCVTETYEPGSPYKIFTLAGALEEHSIEKDDTFYCEGSITMFEYTIHCVETYGHGTLDVKDAIAQSCNIAIMDIAQKEGILNFCKYQSLFGFGKYTDIDLPSEVSCKNLMYTTQNMTEIDLATNSFGQNFNVTMIQMVSAFSSVVNGGSYYKPFVVKDIYDEDGMLVKANEAQLVSITVSEDTADFLKEAMRLVVTEGSGKRAAVEGYITAGKTGTAEKGASTDDLWVASFIGFAPYENPEVVCYVVVDEPASGGEGSSAYACRMFSDIMSEVLPYLNVTPADEDYDPTGLGSPYTDETEDTYDYDEYYDEYYDEW